MTMEHFLRIGDCLFKRELVRLAKWGQQAGQFGEKSFKIKVARWREDDQKLCDKVDD